ncbi:MAG: carotenoid 1,2-hydratase [Paracoccaceae bacterium]
MFSTYYWFAGRRRPENHCCLNLALYGPRKHWAMTERGEGDLARTADTLAIGPSSMAWEDGRLVLDVDERSTPFPRLERPYPMRGRIVLDVEAPGSERHYLDHARRHEWQPLAPSARVRVEMAEPALSWSGHAYLDTNAGTEPLEAGFRRWDWSRTRFSDGASAILYDRTLADGRRVATARRIDRTGRAEPFEPPERRALPRGSWFLDRHTQAEAAPRLVQSFEDAPFYTRAAIETTLCGERAPAVHETLDCRRLSNFIVRGMLNMRIPRRPGSGL